MMETKDPFGEISLITIGDLYSVFDKWIFENSATGYNALASTTMSQCQTAAELSHCNSDASFVVKLMKAEQADFVQWLNSNLHDFNSFQPLLLLSRLKNELALSYGFI